MFKTSALKSEYCIDWITLSIESKKSEFIGISYLTVMCRFLEIEALGQDLCSASGVIAAEAFLTSFLEHDLSCWTGRALDPIF